MTEITMISPPNLDEDGQRIVTTADARFGTYLEAYGAVFNGTTDDSAAIQEAIDASTYDAANSYRAKRIQFPTGAVKAKINTGLVIKAGLILLDGNGILLDCSGMSSGYALRVQNMDSAPYDNYNFGVPIHNIRMIGPNAADTTVDGIGIGSNVSGNTAGLARVAFHDLFVYGFRDGIYFGDDTYILDFFGCSVRACKRYGLNVETVTNAGEKISFHGGQFGDHENSGNATAIYLKDGGNADISFSGATFSYNDRTFNVQSGQVSFFGGHFEDDNYAREIGIIAHNAGNDLTGVFLNGCTVSVTETGANSRTAIFSVAGDKAFLVGNARFVLYDKSSAIVTVPSGLPHVDFRGSTLDLTGVTYFPTVGSYLNMLNNPGFESAALTSWASSGTGFTFTADAGAAKSGTYSAKIVATAGGSGSLRQAVNCRPGQQLLVKGWVKVTVRSAGTLYVRVSWNDSAATQISTTEIKSWVATTADFELAYKAIRVPAGIQIASIQVYGDASFNGTAYADDFEAYIL